MKLLKEISDKAISIKGQNFVIREASRAVLFDEKWTIPLLYVSRHHYHKLPGGGIKKGETKEQALVREVREEVGSTIDITSEIGKVIEFRSQWNLKQISYGYLGKITSKGSPAFTKKELGEGFELKWFTLEAAIVTLTSDQPSNYEGKFIKQRDLVFLKAAKKIIREIS